MSLLRGCTLALSAALVTLLLIAAARPASAQTATAAQSVTGTISGTVRITSDSTLAGATVKVRNDTVSLERTVITDERGMYSVSNLPRQGSYEVQVDFSGFAPMIQQGISLSSVAQVVVDVVLHAASNETMVVTGRIATTLEPAGSAVQQTVSDALVHMLPMVGRDFITLASLTPGFNGNPNYPNAQGQQYWGNNVIVDGASHYSKWRGAARTFYSGYPLEAIKDVQVFTSQFPAEYGESLASITSAVTNAGTDDLHGSMLLFAQTTVFNDIPAFTPERPPFGLQRFGATAGGPLAKERTHYFMSYEGRRQRGHAVITSPLSSGALTDNNEDEHLFFAKLDHKRSVSDLWSGRYSGQRFRWRDEPGGLSLAGTGSQVDDDVHTALLSGTRLVSDAALNQLRVQFARYTNLRTDLQPSVYAARNGYSITGGLNGPYGIGATPENTSEVGDTVSYRTGAHALKSGGSLKYVAVHNETLPYGYGAYFFGGAPGRFPSPFSYIQGIAASEAQASADPKSLSAALFAQDNWRVRPAVTLDLGLRYDVESVRNIDGFEVGADRNNLQPRFGLVWAVVPGKLLVRGGTGIYNQQHLLFYINKVQLEGVNGTSVIRLTPQSPLFPTYPNTLPASVVSQVPRDIQRLAPEFRNPYALQATAGVERLLPRGVVVSADWVYLRGQDLMSLVDVNAPASLFKPNVRTVAQADATRPLAPTAGGFRKIIELGNQGDSWYRALQIKGNKTTGRLQTMAAYTWGHADDRANYLLPEDSRNLDAEKARADSDVRHNLTIGFTWQLPVVARRLNGLVLAGVGTVRSGRPYTETWGDDRNGTTQDDARPGLRNSLTTTAFQNLDLSLARQYRFGPRAIEGRIEAFNLLSTVNEDQFEGNLNSSLYAQPLSAFPRRRIQFAAILRF